MSADPRTEPTRRELLGAGLAAGIAPGLASAEPAARIKLGPHRLRRPRRLAGGPVRP
jgi:hypothetical protein